MENIQIDRSEGQKIIQAKKNKQRKLKKIVYSLLFISLFFFFTTLYSQYEVYTLNKLEARNEKEHIKIPKTPKEIVDAVSRHIILPDTIPQIAAVEDAKKLSSAQDFFKHTINGDIVLVYETTIIVYRPSQDILVAVGDISGVQK